MATVYDVSIWAQMDTGESFQANSGLGLLAAVPPNRLCSPDEPNEAMGQ